MLQLIHVFTTGSLFLLTFLLSSKPQKVNQKANFWLTLFVFLVACEFVDDCLAILSLTEKYPIFEDLINLPIFLLAPALFLSVSYFTNPQKKFRQIDYLHFLPFVLFLFLPILFFVFTSELTIKNDLQANGDWIGLTIVILLFTQILAYTFFSLFKIHQHQQHIRLFASATQTIDLAWLQYFLYGVAFLVLLWMSEVFFSGNNQYAYLGYFVGVFYLAYFALKQEEIYPFTDKETLEIIEVIEEIKLIEEKRQSLFPNFDLLAEKSRLIELMRTAKPYLDNELSLPKLAQMLDISTHELSFLLNGGFEENFYEFVNRYRVEESKHLLKDAKFQHLNMVGIAFEAGFNSKTAFNTTFKRMTGQTPSEFRSLYK